VPFEDPLPATATPTAKREKPSAIFAPIVSAAIPWVDFTGTTGWTLSPAIADIGAASKDATKAKVTIFFILFSKRSTGIRLFTKFCGQLKGQNGKYLSPTCLNGPRGLRDSCTFADCRLHIALQPVEAAFRAACRISNYPLSEVRANRALVQVGQTKVTVCRATALLQRRMYEYAVVFRLLAMTYRQKTNGLLCH
jgi:hypothetical protein